MRLWFALMCWLGRHRVRNRFSTPSYYRTTYCTRCSRVIWTAPTYPYKPRPLRIYAPYDSWRGAMNEPADTREVTGGPH